MYTEVPKWHGVAVKLYVCITEVPGSHRGRETGYPEVFMASPSPSTRDSTRRVNEGSLPKLSQVIIHQSTLYVLQILTA
jgi:hypothetical protein